MKKRIVCILTVIIMLIGMIPATVIPTFAALGTGTVTVPGEYGPHKEVKVTYDWNNAHTECTATKHCDDCNEDILIETATKITSTNTPAEDCHTTNTITYTATFPTLPSDTKNVSGDVRGPHHFDRGHCDCGAEQSLADAREEAIAFLTDFIGTERLKDPVFFGILIGAQTVINMEGSIDGIFEIQDQYVEVINKLTHTFSTEWTYNDTHHWKECTCGHDVVSDFGTHVFDDGVTVGNATTYTCKCGYTKVVYDKPSDTEGEIIGGVAYTDISLTLDSDISMNFYMTLSEKALEGGKMVFTIGDRKVEGVTVQYNTEKEKYYFSCPLNALEMAETVTATFTADGKTYIEEFSVKDYVESILAGDYSDEMKMLAKKIANYGYYIQYYLESIHTNVTIGDDGYTEMPKFDDFDIDLITAESNLTDGFVKPADTDDYALYGRTVYFDSATALNYYITVKNGKELTNDDIVCDKDTEVTHWKDNIYIVSVKDIEATELADKITVTVGDLVLESSVLDYCGAVMHKKDQTENAKKAMAAFYEYYKSACEYAESLKAKHRVTFDMCGYCPSITVYVTDGNTVSRPYPDPETGNYIFIDWYTDYTFETLWDFDTPITDYTEIYAKWMSEKDFAAAKENAKLEVSNLADTVIDEINSLILPDDIKQNFITEVNNAEHTAINGIEDAGKPAEIENKVYTAANKINEVLNNAKKSVIVVYTVSFDMMAHGTQISSQAVRYGEKVTQPEDPTAEGYTFGGWYKDQNLSRQWNFNTGITEDTILYAKWTENK